ncbi:molybdopterin-binding protein [Neptunicoccus cionae]|uniref:Molybdopterin molybdenumtransferase n=1 Tax=Neptunicoccus cionae TaxID=2035344 RepID=A0A916VPC0_9RHOB|nr:gephyrin-like molybdotransferase Glp [Amylibacter cionae]GGA16253.1 molybdopterin molybdenumtransferase MoeA [Amylibacter cionae]
MQPPPLKDDCFAMPPGVDWTPVDTALVQLRDRLHAVTPVETVALAAAGGRILAQDVSANRSSPPYANSAVDGYGLAHAGLPNGEICTLPLAQGRAAAGGPLEGKLPDGHAVRILTGARLPEAVDTVVLEEDCSVEADRIAFRSGLRQGANTRKAGEDVAKGAVVLARGRRLQPQDLALLASVGVAEVPVCRRLRVAVLSTGDEVLDIAAGPAKDAQIYDANRPMLLHVLQRWGYDAVDLGHVQDDPAMVEDAFRNGAAQADAIITSGGASAGDEDHVSAVLKAKGGLQNWRIAMKPGRPLALALWDGVPVFGLPGNPVAALVCTLIFARPALGVLAGAGWLAPQGFSVPAAFGKSKKAGRREYLRARIRDGRAEVYHSEGSGRISGLSWAEGLVELGDGAQDVGQGDLVTFYPYGAFGL